MNEYTVTINSSLFLFISFFALIGAIYIFSFLFDISLIEYLRKQLKISTEIIVLQDDRIKNLKILNEFLFNEIEENQELLKKFKKFLENLSAKKIKRK